MEVRLAYLATGTHSIRRVFALPFGNETYRICMSHTTARQSDHYQHDPFNAARSHSSDQIALPATGAGQSVAGTLQEWVLSYQGDCRASLANPALRNLPRINSRGHEGLLAAAIDFILEEPVVAPRREQHSLRHCRNQRKASSCSVRRDHASWVRNCGRSSGAGAQRTMRALPNGCNRPAGPV